MKILSRNDFDTAQAAINRALGKARRLQRIGVGTMIVGLVLSVGLVVGAFFGVPKPVVAVGTLVGLFIILVGERIDTRAHHHYDSIHGITAWAESRHSPEKEPKP